MINEEENLLGISYDADRVLTTFDDVRAIVEDLKKSGVAAVTVQMTGWYNGGLNYTAPAKIDVDGLLGGEKGLRNLLGAYAADDSVQVYPSFDLGFVMRTAIFDGFSGVRDAARTMEGKLSTKKSIDLAVNKLEETGRLVINSQSAARYAAAVRRFLDENGGGGVSLQGIGSDVFGSYKKGGFVRRESAVEAYRGLLEKQAAAGPVLVESGNAYALPFATDVLSLPYGDSGYPNYGERVAFVQMVLHGQVGYGIAPINLSEDVELQILRCIETGASPAFTIARRNISALRGDAFYNKYYAVDYSVLADTIADSYRQVSSVLGRVGALAMFSLGSCVML